MTESVQLSIIIVNWNVEALLHQALTSIYASWSETSQLEVIVIDNASTDNSVKMVQQNFPHVHIIANTTNMGYPAGCNQGLAVSSGQYRLILNPDTEIVGNALSALVQYMAGHPAVGLAGPALIYPDGTHQSSRRRFPTLAILFLESTWMEKFSPRSFLNNYYFLDQPDSVTQEVDWVTGAAMIIRREVWDKIGGLDEGFFMYSEELDWCKRIKMAGYSIVYFPEATIIHHEGKSSEQVVAERHIYFQTSKIRYTRIYYGHVVVFILYHWIRLQYISQILFEGVKWLLGHKQELRSSRIAAYKRVLQSRFR